MYLVQSHGSKFVAVYVHGMVSVERDAFIHHDQLHQVTEVNVQFVYTATPFPITILLDAELVAVCALVRDRRMEKL